MAINLRKQHNISFKKALIKIYDLDPMKDSKDINERAKAECFILAQKIAAAVLGLPDKHSYEDLDKY